VGSVGLFVSLFFDWFTVSIESPPPDTASGVLNLLNTLSTGSLSGWSNLGWLMDVLLCIAIIGGLSLSYMTVKRTSPAWPIGAGVLTVALGAAIALALALRLVDLVTIFALLREPPRRRSAAPRGHARDVATVVSRSTRAIAASTVLASLVAVELFWGFGMTAMELLPAPKLGDVMSDLDAAAALLGPVSTASWFIAALGAAAAPRLATRIGNASGAMVLHAVLAAAILAMALVTGPAGVVTCLLVAFGAHGAINPLYQSLVHRQADAATRTTIVSATSMTAQLGGALGAVMLGAIATGVSIDVAIAVGSLALLATIPLYLPARRQDLGRASELRNAAPVG
jgi:hypothetical protein